MVWAIVLVVVFVILTVFFLRPRKIIKLKKLKLKQRIFQKINHEIKIFNKMHLIMPSKKGVPLLYLKWLERLHAEPRRRVKSTDGFERLLYLCAAAKLYESSRDEPVRRQLLKNCWYVLGGAVCCTQ